eukprot:symbB.v1.2.000937.t1/scaffold54.1/size375170/10
MWQGKVPKMQIALAETTEVQKAKKCGTGPSGHLMIYVLTDLEAEVEIFNTYGEFSNDKLLQDYGFILEHNAFNTVTLPRTFLESPGCGHQMAWAKKHRKELKLLQDGDEHEDMEGGEEEDLEEDPAMDEESGGSVRWPRPVWPRQLRILLAVLATPLRQLQKLQKSSKLSLMKISSTRLWWKRRVRQLLRKALRRRWAQYPQKCQASEERQRWRERLDHESKEAAALGLRIGEKEILAPLKAVVNCHPRALLSRCGATLESQAMWFLSQTCKQIVEVHDGQVKHYDGDYRFYMDSNNDVRRKVEAHYTGIDGLIESVPASLEERKKKERKGLRKNRGKKLQQERQAVIQSGFLQSREWRR